MSDIHPFGQIGSPKSLPEHGALCCGPDPLGSINFVPILTQKKYLKISSSRNRTSRRAGESCEDAMITVDELAKIPLFSALAIEELEYLGRTVADIHLIPGEYAA